MANELIEYGMGLSKQKRVEDAARIVLRAALFCLYGDPHPLLSTRRASRGRLHKSWHPVWVPVSYSSEPSWKRKRVASATTPNMTPVVRATTTPRTRSATATPRMPRRRGRPPSTSRMARIKRYAPSHYTSPHPIPSLIAHHPYLIISICTLPCTHLSPPPPNPIVITPHTHTLLCLYL